MGDSLVRVEATDHFLARIDSIGEFFDAAEAAHVFVRLLEELQSIVFPNLARFPTMGRRFVDLQPRAAEALAALRTLPIESIGALREYLHGEYLILYSHEGAIVYLLTIRHHREMAYDFLRIWPSR